VGIRPTYTINRPNSRESRGLMAILTPGEKKSKPQDFCSVHSGKTGAGTGAWKRGERITLSPIVV